MKKYLTIRNWSVEDRPRERLLEKGPQDLSNAELLAILINTGAGQETAVDLAKRMLHEADNNLQKLSRWSVDELKTLRGIGEAKAVTIQAAFELGKRTRFGESANGESVTTSCDVFKVVRPLIATLDHEEFWVLYLNRGNKIIAREKLSSGGTGGTVTDVKMIVRKAVHKLSDGIIVAHNHPSGNIDPSQADKKITEKLKEAVLFFDIRLLDHIIVAGEKYYSFADEGMM
jgi:DNA repair protein RadC